MVKNCKKPKKEKEDMMYYKCNRVEHLVKNCKLKQKIKNRSIQEKSDNKKDNDKEADFIEISEQVWYDEPLYIIIF